MKLSAEHRAKISAALTGRSIPEQTREKMRKPKASAQNMLKPKTEQHARNISLGKRSGKFNFIVWATESGLLQYCREPVVYYVATPDLRYVKIGFSNSVTGRIAEIQAYHPEQCTVLAIESGTLEVERSRHKQFARYFVQNEWFRHEGQLKAFIKRLPYFTQGSKALL